ncbi:hypothetical protein LCGC14_2575680, partial [marine sediment metagenome]
MGKGKSYHRVPPLAGYHTPLVLDREGELSHGDVAKKYEPQMPWQEFRRFAGPTFLSDPNRGPGVIASAVMNLRWSLQKTLRDVGAHPD